MAVISLLTDFGVQDEFVGVMHGVILRIAPSARIVDLCHAVPPGDCRRAAYLLAWAARYFPPRTIHVVVVDPGVGTKRRILCAEADGQRFVAPDNGVLTLVLQAAKQPVLYDVRESRYWLRPVSATFHGRDIMAPVAAHLARGVRPRALGARTTTWIRLALPRRGAVIDIDRFGNLITNLGGAPRGSATVRVKGRAIRGLVPTFGLVRRGALAAMLGSRGLIEIAVREGSAAKTLKAKVGDPVVLTAG